MYYGNWENREKRGKKRGGEVNHLSYNTARHITSEDSTDFSVFLGAFFST